MGDGFMMGYMLGAIPWYWSMPFHPAYYYSRPATVVNPDGTTAVYPGTFEWGTLFMTLLVIGGILYIGYVWLRNRRRRMAYTTAGTMAASFDDDQRPGAQSSFM
jgi:cbb3-type cytochrome oxidase subunit 3